MDTRRRRVGPVEHYRFAGLSTGRLLTRVRRSRERPRGATEPQATIALWDVIYRCLSHSKARSWPQTCRASGKCQLYSRGATLMMILSRRDVVRLLAASMLLLLPATSGAQQPSPIGEKLAKTYGIESFEKIEAIRYTFDAQRPGADVSRSWIWEPKTDQVIYEGKDKS